MMCVCDMVNGGEQGVDVSGEGVEVLLEREEWLDVEIVEEGEGGAESRVVGMCNRSIQGGKDIQMCSTKPDFTAFSEASVKGT